MQISTPKHAAPPEDADEAEETDRQTDGGGLGCTESGHRLVPDGQKLHVSGELLILAVGNGRQAGGGMRLCPYAGQSLCDGLTLFTLTRDEQHSATVTTRMVNMKLTVVVTLVMTDACGDGHGNEDVFISGFQALRPCRYMWG